MVLFYEIESTLVNTCKKNFHLQVKLANCEMKLRSALKLMAIGHEQLEIIRSSIKTVCALTTPREPHCRPFLFVIYVLEVFSGATVQSRILTKMKNRFVDNCAPSNEDKQFAYNFALESLGMYFMLLSHTLWHEHRPLVHNIVLLLNKFLPCWYHIAFSF